MSLQVIKVGKNVHIALVGRPAALRCNDGQTCATEDEVTQWSTYQVQGHHGNQS